MFRLSQQAYHTTSHQMFCADLCSTRGTCVSPKPKEYFTARRIDRGLKPTNGTFLIYHCQFFSPSPFSFSGVEIRVPQATRASFSRETAAPRGAIAFSTSPPTPTGRRDERLEQRRIEWRIKHA